MSYVRLKAVCVCLCVNQGGTNQNPYTKLRAQPTDELYDKPKLVILTEFTGFIDHHRKCLYL